MRNGNLEILLKLLCYETRKLLMRLSLSYWARIRTNSYNLTAKHLHLTFKSSLVNKQKGWFMAICL